MCRWALWLLVVTGLGVPASEASTWRVGGPDGDFTEIRDALTASVDGDIILVRPGTYLSFTVQKGVTVVASSAPFIVQAPGITVSGVAAGKSAAVVGAGLIDAGRLVVTNSPGEVVLADLSVLSGTVDPVSITSAANVSVARVTITSVGASTSAAPPPAVTIQNSGVRISGFEIDAADGADEGLGIDGASGSAGLLVSGSQVVLARGTVIGGNGGRGADGAGGNGGAGGDAVSAVNTTLIVMGETLDWLQGGDGGIGSSNGGVGGDGGAGLRESGGSALVSRVTLSGGAGGGGSVPGSAGPDAEGNVTRDDRLAYLDATGLLLPGSSFALDLTAVEAGGVVLIVSQLGGFLATPFLGPPLSALPGGWFLILFVGRTDGIGRYHLDAAVPSGAFVQGLLFHTQAAVLGDSTTTYLTNELGLVVGE